MGQAASALLCIDCQRRHAKLGTIRPIFGSTPTSESGGQKSPVEKGEQIEAVQKIQENKCTFDVQKLRRPQESSISISQDIAFKGIAPDATALVGNTPMVFIDRICEGLPGRIAAKVEFFNPTCSVKDRAGYSMISEAERKGILIPGKSVLIECTSGNMGISMAQIAAVRGYKIILIMPEKSSLERRAMMKAYGAELILMDATQGIKEGVERAYQMAVVIPNSVVLDQFVNPANPLVHYCTTGKEIWEQTEGKVDAVVFGVGTGGTMTGAGRFLQEQNPDIEVYGVEPVESSVINGLPKGKHLIQGIGTGMLPGTLDTSIIKECLRVSSDDAIAMARRIAREEGLMVGISSGANVAAAVQLASRPEMKGKLIVTSFADFGERYLSSTLYKDVFEATSAQTTSTLKEDIERFADAFNT